VIDVAVIAAAPAVRAGLRVLLASDPALRVIGEGATLAELQHSPLDSVEIAVVHALPSIQITPRDLLRGVLFVVDDWSTATALRDVRFAWGIVPSDVTAEGLIAAVTSLYHGLIVIHPDVAVQLVAQPSVTLDEVDPLAEPLTSREQEVLQLVGQGLANKMIADRLHISEHTVKFHVSAIYAKLGVASRTEAVRAGARRGLIVL